MKTKRYWLRGGIIGLIAWPLWHVPVIYLYLDTEPKGIVDNTIVGFGSWILMLINEVVRVESIFLAFLIVAMTFVIYGTIVGYLYGKFKNKGKRSI
jgi:hypothetical protein